MGIRKTLCYMVLMLTLSTVSSGGSVSALWFESTIISATDEDENKSYERCVNEEIAITESYGPSTGLTVKTIGCVLQAKDYDIARYLGADNSYHWGFKLKIASGYVQISGLGINSKPIASTANNMLHYLEYSSYTYNNTSFVGVSDLASSIEDEAYDSYGRVISKKIKTEAKKKYFLKAFPDQYSDENYQVWSLASSQNGRFALLWLDARSQVKLDLNNGSAQVLSLSLQSLPVGVYSQVSLAITDDGKYAFAGGPKVIDTQNCGYSFNGIIAMSQEEFADLAVECNAQIFEVSKYTGFEGYASNPRWVLSNEILEFTYRVFPYSISDWMTIKPASVSISIKGPNISRIAYLALGDSYSSGEGDTGRKADGKAYYLEGTVDKKGCHISSRSYPFTLARNTNLSDASFKSIACSGAKVGRDYYGSSDKYYGQHDQLKSKTIAEVGVARDAALTSFTPAVLKQVDFVRQHKPKTITLNGGGNDIGFGKLMSYCALPSGVGEAGNTCNQAMPNTLQRAMLGDAIKSQYDKTIELINAIKAASDKTTVYIVGYPSFVSSDKQLCANSGMLNQKERTVINESVSYLNNILRSAAKNGGAHFVDIESSLKGGRICEESEYVTGPIDVLGFDIADRKPEIFHPNSKGHELMASAILGGGFKIVPANNPSPVVNPVPSVPKSFGNGTHVPSYQESLLTDGILSIGQGMKLSVAPGWFLADSMVSFTMYSQEEQLGRHKTASEGSITSTVKMPKSIKPGYHMVIAEGTGADGRKLRLYQFIEVQDTESDRDSDGRPDTKDSCLYVTTWIDEATGKDICTGNLSDKPGLGQGYGYGHLMSSGVHDGHNWTTRSLP